jgi:branched-chain amino acid transport system ATP-binding protein
MSERVEANKCHDRLRVTDLVSGYGKKRVLNGVSLEALHGEIVGLIGHNGAGKSTLLKALFGMIPIWQGTVVVDGKIRPKPSPIEMLRSGVAYVPQGNRVFTNLTVAENLEICSLAVSKKGGTTDGIERAVTLFPSLRALAKRRAGTLSGGEKQVLALASALTLSPRMLFLDEPSLGLAPSLVVQTLEQIREVAAKAETTVLIVEQKVRAVLNICDRVYVLRNGGVSFSGPSAALKDDVKLREVYL